MPEPTYTATSAEAGLPSVTINHPRVLDALGSDAQHEPPAIESPKAFAGKRRPARPGR